MGSISTHLQTFWAGDPVQFGGVSLMLFFVSQLHDYVVLLIQAL